jgi:hypothetical protein
LGQIAALIFTGKRPGRRNEKAKPETRFGFIEHVPLCMKDLFIAPLISIPPVRVSAACL